MKLRLDIYRSVFNFAIICTALADSVNLDNSRQRNHSPIFRKYDLVVYRR